MKPWDHPDPRVQLRHYRGAYEAMKHEVERLTIELSNTRRKLQMLTSNAVGAERVWSNAVDGRK